MMKEACKPRSYASTETLPCHRLTEGVKCRATSVAKDLLNCAAQEAEQAKQSCKSLTVCQVLYKSRYVFSPGAGGGKRNLQEGPSSFNPHLIISSNCNSKSVELGLTGS